MYLDDAVVLVRTSKEGSVDRLIPTSNDLATIRLFVGLSREFGVTFTAGAEDLQSFGNGDLD